ncbi:ccr4 associated factor [Podochytrium sp. JEL0797]|nr:ccr4 associated factor [Podochytrium sp. JEL0797]
MSANHVATLARGVLSVSGSDAAKFLQGLTTNNMLRIEHGGAGLFAGFLTAPGRVIADAFVHPRNASGNSSAKETQFLVDVDPRAAASLVAHLRKYALRAKVAIEDVSQEFQVHQAWGPHAALWDQYVGDVGKGLPAGTVLTKDRWIQVGCKDPRNPSLGVRYLVPKGEKANLPASFSETSELEYKIHRILNGIPEGMDDIFTNVSLPLESNFDLMSGVDFRKGCYLGQELTIRTYHIGVTRKRIVPVQIFRETDELSFLWRLSQLTLDRTFTDPLPPSMSEIRLLSKKDGTMSKREVGKFCSGVHNIGLALVRLEQAGHVADSELVLSPDAAARGLRVRAFPPSWFPAPVAEE